MEEEKRITVIRLNSMLSGTQTSVRNCITSKTNFCSRKLTDEHFYGEFRPLVLKHLIELILEPQRRIKGDKHTAAGIQSEEGNWELKIIKLLPWLQQERIPEHTGYFSSVQRRLPARITDGSICSVAAQYWTYMFFFKLLGHILASQNGRDIKE